MKNALLFLMLLIMGIGAKAQVGIGTDMPDPSAQLDITVQAGDKGILIARIALTGTTDVTTIANGNVESLLVYNTATVADVTPGYYYWYNDKWKRIVTPDDISTMNPNTVNVGLTTDGVDLILNDSDGNFVSIPLSSLSTGTITNLVDNGDGTITYTNEEGTVQTMDIASIAQNNESVTTLTDNGDGTYTYTSEDGTAVTFDANTSTVTDNGDGTYTITNADGTTATIDVPGDVLTELQDNTSDIYTEVISLINTEIVANSDALVDNGDGTFTHTAADGTVVIFDANTSTVTDNGDGTYTVTNADGTTVTIDVAGDVLAELQDNTSDIHSEILSLIDANETITTLAVNAGALEYTNEDNSNSDVSLISTDADNTLVAGTDGALFVRESESINIYNSNGTLTSNREVTLDGNSLTFQGEDGYLDIEAGGSHMTLHGANPDRARLRLSTDDLNGNGTNSTFDMSLFSDNYLQMFAMGEMGGISFGTHNTLNPSPIEFLTSPGGGALGETRIKIEGNGNINFTQYPNTRDDSGVSPVSNILYTDDGGNLLSAPAANLAIEPWQVQATTDKATDNTQDIYQTGSVAIGTDDIPDLLVGGDDLTSTVKLHVDGNITTTGKLYTTNSVYADYVFEKYFNGHSDLNTKYEFASLNDVKKFIKKNHHLPGITSIADLSKSEKGYTFDLTSLSIQQLEKIEELFIHTIEQQELLEKQQAQLEKQQKELAELKDRLAKIERLLGQQ